MDIEFDYTVISEGVGRIEGDGFGCDVVIRDGEYCVKNVYGYRSDIIAAIEVLENELKVWRKK